MWEPYSMHSKRNSLHGRENESQTHKLLTRTYTYTKTYTHKHSKYIYSCYEWENTRNLYTLALVRRYWTSLLAFSLFLFDRTLSFRFVSEWLRQHFTQTQTILKVALYFALHPGLLILFDSQMLLFLHATDMPKLALIPHILCIYVLHALWTGTPCTVYILFVDVISSI